MRPGRPPYIKLPYRRMRTSRLTGEGTVRSTDSAGRVCAAQKAADGDRNRPAADTSCGWRTAPRRALRHRWLRARMTQEKNLAEPEGDKGTRLPPGAFASPSASWPETWSGTTAL